MTGECPNCGNGKIMTMWPQANETREGSCRSGKLKMTCFEALHEFEILLPSDPTKISRLLNEAFPTRS